MKLRISTINIKIIAILMLGISCGALQAQPTGRVGINTDTPKATLEINAHTNGSSQTEGILIPRLTGDEVKNMPTANIETSTMIFATSAATAPLASHAINLTSVGYFYYDGAKWVRFTNDDILEWVFNQSTERIDLKRSNTSLSSPAPSFNNYIYYNKDGYFKNYEDLNITCYDNNLADRNWNLADMQTNITQAKVSSLGDAHGLTPASGFRALNRNILIADPLTTAAASYISVSEDAVYVDKNNTANFPYITSYNVKASHAGQGTVDKLSPHRSIAIIGNAAKANTVQSLDAFVIVADGSTAENVYGVRATTQLRKNPSTITNAIGVSNIFQDKNKNNMGSTIINLKGFENHFDLDKKTTQDITNATGFETKLKLTTKSKSSIGTLTGFKYTSSLIDNATTATVTTEYGIYLEDVIKGATSYGIYTNQGKNSFGDQVEIRTINANPSTNNSDKIVVADATTGELKVAGTIAPLRGIQKVSEIQMLNVEKIEKLYQQTKEQDKKIKAQEVEIQQLSKQNMELKQRLEKIESFLQKMQ